MEERPVEVYAVALGLLRDYRQTLPGTIAKGLEDMARSAARNSLRDPLPSTAEMNINPDDHARLTRYNRRCRLRLVGSLATGDLIKRTGAEWIRRDAKCEVCPSVSGEPSAALGITEHPETWRARYWKGITASIGEFPCEESFGNDQIWNSTLQILEKECPRCYKTAEEEYPRFKQKAIQVITEIIDEVSIHLLTGLSAKKS